jgi:hypothetical protein
VSDAHELGPLAPLAGTWEGDEGKDVAPSDDRGTETNDFRERMTFEPIGRVENHEQALHGLRYTTTAWRLGEADPFHEEVGYWLWDGGAKQVMRCFIVPRGVTVLAGGLAEPDAKQLVMSAELGSPTFGIASNPFLHEHFQTVRYDLTVTLHEDGRMSYAEDTHLRMPGRSEVFHHTDANTLKKL